MIHKIFIGLCSLSFFFSCVSKNFKEPEVTSVGENEVKSQSFKKPYAKVWSSVLTALENQKYAIAESKTERGLIITDWTSGKSDRLFSGYGEVKIPYNIRYRLTINLRPFKDGTKVFVENDEQYYSDSITAGTEFKGSLYQWIPTPSSGQKEAFLLEDVQRQLSLTSGVEK